MCVCLFCGSLCKITVPNCGNESKLRLAKKHAKLGTFLNIFFSFFSTKKYQQLVNSRKKAFPSSSSHKWGFPNAKSGIKKRKVPCTLHWEMHPGAFLPYMCYVGYLMHPPGNMKHHLPVTTVFDLIWPLIINVTRCSWQQVKQCKGQDVLQSVSIILMFTTNLRFNYLYHESFCPVTEFEAINAKIEIDIFKACTSTCEMFDNRHGKSSKTFTVIIF
jgi:hypothetical protein